jgi:hypothetical protein
MGQPRQPLLPAKARAALEATGLPWGWRRGTKHWKLFIGGRMAVVLPYRVNGQKTEAPRMTENMVRDIRRTARQVKGEE